MRKLITMAVFAAVVLAASSSAVASADPPPDYSGTFAYTPIDNGHNVPGAAYLAHQHNK